MAAAEAIVWPLRLAALLLALGLGGRGLALLALAASLRCCWAALRPFGARAIVWPLRRLPGAVIFGGTRALVGA